MPIEQRSGVKVESRIAPSLKKKFQTKAKKQNITVAEVLRNLIQGYVKA